VKRESNLRTRQGDLCRGKARMVAMLDAVAELTNKGASATGDWAAIAVRFRTVP